MYMEFKKIFYMIEKDDRNKVIEALRIYNEACQKAEDGAPCKGSGKGKQR